jgi:uroporphyrinogen decarboxylase
MNETLIRACLLERTRHRPVWFMRQAGRYLPEYREMRKKYSLFELCRMPELAAEIASIPVRRFNLDAAIVFSDLMIPLTEMGLKIRIDEGVGPVLSRRVEGMAQVREIKNFDPSSVSFVYEAVKRTIESLSNSVPVIGFAGAPYTLASYLIEGGASRDYLSVKLMMYSKKNVWEALMEKLTDMCTAHLMEQYRAGCRVVQIFDSWAGSLSPEDYRDYVLPFTEKITDALSSAGALVIHFSTGNPMLIPLMACKGVNVVSVDWRLDIRKAMDMLPGKAVQGNLEPALMSGPEKLMLERATEILRRTEGRRGHIFSLGHGMPRNARISNVRELVKLIHRS